MDDLPLVSFIVPAFNAERYLRECVESILAQPYGKIEVIIVNDGSTDRTGQLADGLAKSNPKIRAASQPNQGPACARNAGLRIAKGELIAFVDADDALHPQFLDAALPSMRSSGADIFCCSFESGPKPHWKPASWRPLALKPKDAIEQVLYQRSGMHCSAWGHVFKRGILDDEIFAPGLIYEDLDFFYRAYERANLIAYVGAPMYFYRVNPCSIMHTFSDKRLAVLDVTNRIAERYSGDPQLRMAAIDRRFSANYNMFVLCSRNSHPAARVCWNEVKAHRLEVLLNSKSRLKNRLGALISFLGQRAALAIASIFYPTA